MVSVQKTTERVQKTLKRSANSAQKSLETSTTIANNGLHKAVRTIKSLIKTVGDKGNEIGKITVRASKNALGMRGGKRHYTKKAKKSRRGSKKSRRGRRHHKK